MNSLKTLFIVAVLGAVAYGVYVSINRNPETSAVPDAAPAWPEAPQVEIPGPGGASPEFPPGRSATGMAPPFSSGPTGAPIAATPATPYASLASSAPPIADPARGAPSAAAAGNSPLAPGRGDTPGLSSSPLPGVQGPPSQPLRDGAPPNGDADKFAAFLQTVQAQLEAGRLAEAHLALSSLYDNPSVPPELAQEVTNLLDQLAGTVIYSRQHLLEQPYLVRPGDTLEQIAGACKVPWQLLARVNGIRDPQHLEPGRELKVVRGPFSALVDLRKYELTLMVGGRYAGRFPIGMGRDHATIEGSYTVRDKITNPPYSGPDVSFSADDPNNPLGEIWIDLGNRIGLHGTNDPQNLHRTAGRGSVCLGDEDIRDVFGILSIGSRVIIRR